MTMTVVYEVSGVCLTVNCNTVTVNQKDTLIFTTLSSECRRWTNSTNNVRDVFVHIPLC